jgi:curved DNA-binding protein CbpA
LPCPCAYKYVIHLCFPCRLFEYIGCDEKTNLFRKVTDAYDCLSCEQSRRSYDSSLGISSMAMPDMTSARTSKVYAPPKPPPGGAIYNFDEWQRQHYGEEPSAPQQNMRRESSVDRAFHNHNARNSMDQRSDAIKKLHLRREQRRSGKDAQPGCALQ